MQYIVIGSSRGLGAAMVGEILSHTASQVIGISRTSQANIKNHPQWAISGRYRHVELDIASPASRSVLNDISSDLMHEQVCIIFNAALVKTDLEKNGHVDYAITEEVNHVQIDGLVHVLQAFEKHLQSFGGIFVAISSFSALVPPIAEPRLAYPASKAYLDMSMRTLKFAWNEKVKIVTVHLGHITEEEKSLFSRWATPTYAKAAKSIVDIISSKGKIPDEINIPLVYSIVYRYLLPLVPDRAYFYIFGKLAKLLR